MSIYATLWKLKFPAEGDEFPGCEWLTVTAQGVPAHVGSPGVSSGRPADDPFAAFLPPAVDTDEHDEADYLRAVVIVTERTKKGTAHSPQDVRSIPCSFSPARITRA